MNRQLFVAALLASAAAPSFASNFYLLADAGQSKFSIDVEEATVSRTETVLSLGVGYNLNSTFALELAYRNLGELDGREEFYYDNGNYGVVTDTTEISSLQLSVIGSLPLSEKVAIYGRLGIADLKVKNTEKAVGSFDGERFQGTESSSVSKNRALVGVGLNYALGSAFALRAEYSQYAEWDDLTISTTTIGLTYKF